jgi:hypothetical protein
MISADLEYEALSGRHESTGSSDTLGSAGYVSKQDTRDRPTVGDAPEPDSTIIESGLKWTFLAVRMVHLVQGVICVASGWSTYRRPRLAAAVLGLVGAESGWLFARAIRHRKIDALQSESTP